MATTRKKIRLKNYDYSKPGYYFVTICSKNNENIFGHIENDKMILNKYGEIVEKTWTKIPEHFQNVELDEYVIMPDHIHGIINIQTYVGYGHARTCKKNKTPTTNTSSEKKNH